MIVSASVTLEAPMNFVVAEDTRCYGQPNCPRWIAAEGAISNYTPNLLMEILDKSGSKKLPVFLNSSGGDYSAAMLMGTMLRDRDIPVAVGLTSYPRCVAPVQNQLCRNLQPSWGNAEATLSEIRSHCDLACVFVLAGSMRRSVPAGLVMQTPVLYRNAFADDSGWSMVEAPDNTSVHQEIQVYAWRQYLGDEIYDRYINAAASSNTRIDAKTALRFRLASAIESPLETLSASQAGPLPAAVISSIEPEKLVPSAAEKEEIIVSASSGIESAMDFVLLERPDCAGHPGCTRWISAIGLIDQETPNRLQSFMNLKSVSGLVMIVSSRGGDYAAAMELGRMARKANLKIGVGRADYIGCSAGDGCRQDAANRTHSAGAVTERGARCDLACVLLLAGGTERRMPSRTRLIIPKVALQHSDMQAALQAGASLKTSADDGAIRQKIHDYLDEMGMYKSLFVYGVNSKTRLLLPVNQREASQDNIVSNLLPSTGLVTEDVPKAALPAAVRLPEYYIPKKTVSSDMRFYVVTTPSYECNGECKSWIAGIGEITAKSPASLRKVLKSIGKRRLPVILHSQGGSVEAAMQIGRMIRQRQLSVSLGMTSIDRCGGAIGDCAAELPKGAALQGRVLAAGAYCLSACPLIFAGGVERVSSGYSFLGVHQITTVRQIYKIKYMTSYRVKNGKRTDVRRREVGRSFQGTEKTTAMTKAFRRGLLNYLAEMGVDGALLDRMKEAGPEDMRMLTTTEALSLHVMTKEGNVLELIAAQ